MGDASGRSGVHERKRQAHKKELFAGGDKFPTKEVMRGVQAAAEGDRPTLDTALGVILLNDRDVMETE